MFKSHPKRPGVGRSADQFFVYPTRRVSVSFPVALDKDVKSISSRIRTYLERDKRVLKTPPPNISTSNLTEKVVEVSVQALVEGRGC